MGLGGKTMKATTAVDEEYRLAKQRIINKKLCNMDEFKTLTEIKDHYFKNHPYLLQNNLIQKFLEDKDNLCIFVLALFGEKEVNDLLNKLFKKFYVEYRFVSYISQLLYFEAIHFDKKISKQMMTEPAILDMPFEEEGEITLSDAILTDNQKFDYQPNTFEDLIVDEEIYKEYKKLTDKQQYILYHSYYALLKDKEIAEKLNITQQAVSKNRKKALNVLRKSCKGGRK